MSAAYVVRNRVIQMSSRNQDVIKPFSGNFQREGALESSLHGDEHVLADDKSDHAGDQRCHGKHLPVILVDEHAEILAQIDRNLRQAAAVSSLHQRKTLGRLLVLFICIDFCSSLVLRTHSETTCLSAYFLTNSSERPSPPSSFWLILRRIPSIVSVPKNSFASSILP